MADKDNDPTAAWQTMFGEMSKGFNAHIYYVAHHHKMLSGATVKLHEGPEATTRLKATDSRVVAGGSWLRGYIPDEITSRPPERHRPGEASSRSAGAGRVLQAQIAGGPLPAGARQDAA